MFAHMQNMQRTYKIKTTCLEMLRDRGYLVDTTSTHGESTTILVAKPNPKTSKDRVLVVFAQEGKTGVHSIKAVVEQMRDAGADRAIFVSPTPLTAFAKAAVAEVASKFTIEPFLEQELLFNVTHHSPGAYPSGAQQGRQTAPARQVPDRRQTLAAHPAKRSGREVLWNGERAGCAHNARLGDSGHVCHLQAVHLALGFSEAKADCEETAIS